MEIKANSEIFKREVLESGDVVDGASVNEYDVISIFEM
jgi:hypothetical protein